MSNANGGFVSVLLTHLFYFYFIIFYFSLFIFLKFFSLLCVYLVYDFCINNNSNKCTHREMAADGKSSLVSFMSAPTCQ